MMTMEAETTNRDRLMAELAERSNDALYRAFADNRVTRAIDDAMCDDCKAEHGRCMSTGDDTPCPRSLSDWMDMPNTGRRILPQA